MTKNQNTTVAVGLSGGVDSSLSAYILKKRGYSVIGLTMKKYGGEILETNSSKAYCYGPGEAKSIARAKEVAEFIGIPHYVIDLKEEFRKDILEYFTEEYLRGRTPNPCPRCNARVKFSLFLDKAREQGLKFDLFATGHYVRVVYDEERKGHVIKKGLDQKKDQSYFLYGLDRQLLPQLIFPLGESSKVETRKYADELRLPVPRESESQDFIELGKYSTLFDESRVVPGPILDASGRQIGLHKGIVNYTIGQRRGIGVSAPKPLYVIEVNAVNNSITVGDKSLLFSSGLIAANITYLCLERGSEPRRIQAKIRQNHTPSEASLRFDGDKAVIIFDSPQMSVTPGQSVAFYKDDILLGGGIIEEKIS